MGDNRYHTFLSHNSDDKPAVEELAHRLRQEGIEPWLDKWNLIPGEAWQPAIEQALDDCDTCTVFIGPSGFGPWQNEEMRAAIGQRVSQTDGRFRVLPVVLPGGQREERSRLPTFLTATTWVEFRRSLDDDEAFHRLVCGIRGIEPGPAPGSIDQGICPYRGLQAFLTEHARFFFGREALTEWLLDELRPAPGSAAENRFLAIIGASGSGKSSLARAGLVPALKRGELDGSQDWPVVVLRPGQEPVESLAVALAAEPVIGKQSSPTQLMSDLAADERTLHLTARLALHGAPETARVVVLVDQFEEIFTLCDDDALRRALIDNLLYAAHVAGGRTVVVLTMRADFYGKCAGYDALAAALSDHQVLVGPMSDDELRRAIERPAQLVGCELEAGLTEILIRDARNQAGALPLLQHALEQLWERRDGRRFTFAAYEQIGGLAGALERRANQIFEGFNQADREICRRVFLRLTQPGEGTEDTKRRASFQELLPAGEDAAPVEQVVQRLAETRLITTEGDEAESQARFVEVAHEALIRGWSKLRGWIDSDRESLRIHRRLSDDAARWQSSDRDNSYLYAGARLAQAREWAASHAADISTTERSFLQTSTRRARRGRIMRVGTTAVVIVSLIGLSSWALSEKSIAKANEQKANQRAVEAERQTHIATAQRLAVQANAVLAEYPQRSVLLSIQAVKATSKYRDRVPAARQAIRDALANCSGIPLRGHEESITAVAITPDNHWLVTGSDDGTARLWDLTAPDPSPTSTVLRGHEKPIAAVAITPDNHWLVTGSADETARLWDLTAPDPSKTSTVLSGHEKPIIHLAISPDNHWLVTLSAWSRHGMVRLWDLTAPDPSKTSTLLSGHKGSVESVAISRDSRWLVTGSSTVLLWDLTAPDPSKASTVLPGHEGSSAKVESVAISPDNHWLVTGSANGKVLLWDLTAPDPSKTSTLLLPDHGPHITAVAISPDNHWLVTGGWYGTARLWDLCAPDPSTTSTVLRGHRTTIGPVAISPDNHWLVTTSFGGYDPDNAVLLWDLTAPDPSKTSTVLTGHNRSVQSVSFSPDNHWLVTGSPDRTARLWELTAPDPSTTSTVLRGHEGSISHLAISPDNHWLVTGSGDDTARLWDLSAPDPSTTSPVLPAHKSADRVRSGSFLRSISRVAIGRGNHLLVTGSQDGTVLLWDLTAPDPSTTATALPGHKNPITHLVISPDNHWLVTGSQYTTADRSIAPEESTVRLWDLTAPDPKRTSTALRDHKGSVNAVAISPDNHWLVTGGNGTAHLWDLSARDPSTTSTALRGHEDRILAVAISRDNHWLVTASWDGAARLWDLTAPDPSTTSTVLRAREGLFATIAISPDNQWLFKGEWLISAPDNRALAAGRLWDLTARDPSTTSIALRGHEGIISSVAFSPDNHWLVTISTDTARLCDLTAPDPSKTSTVLRGHKVAIAAAAISTDNHWLVTGGYTGAVRLWDLSARDPSTTSTVLHGHKENITAVAFSTDNHWLVTGSADGTARLWTLRLDDLLRQARRVTGRNLYKHEWEQYFPGEPYRKTFADLPDGP